MKAKEPDLKWDMEDTTSFRTTTNNLMYQQYEKTINEIDIIVPFHEQYDLVSELIKSLWRTTRNITYYLCLVDDGSESPRYVEEIERKQWPSVICVSHNERKGM